jgi:uncharacterized protein (DUF697 family)
MATYKVRNILKAVADVRKHTPATARLCLVGSSDLLADAARMLSAGADDAADGGVSRALDVLGRGDFPIRPEALSRWSVVVFLEDAQAAVRPELGPTIAFCRAARLPAVVAAVRDTAAVSFDRHAWIALAGLSSKEFVAHTRGTPAAKSALARRIAALAGQGGFALAAALPALRAAVIEHTIQATARQNALVGAVIILPGADMPVMTMNQLKMVLRIGAAYGYRADLQRTVEMLGVIASGLGMRALARRAVEYVPGLGWAMKASFGYVGTEAIGRSAVAYFENGAPLTASRFPRLSSQLGKFEKIAKGLTR